ncbi:MAG: protein translocase subunit SecF [Deltaproteobacteria bacterium]|nr:protein translocase subunit SecF [Deltaproteobacteria bacterium]
MQITKKEIPFIQNQKLMIAISAFLTIASLILVFWHGLHFGIDFTGGIKLQYKFNQSVDSAKIQEIVEQTLSEKVAIQQFGQPSENLFGLDIQKPSKSIEGFSQSITQSLEKSFGAGSVSLVKEEAVGPKAGEELKKKGQLAVLIAWMLILAYIGFRFDFYFSPGAIVALIHDIVITLGAFAVTGREINLTVVAAFLTIIGYSVSDTIIVYDRVRENALKYKTLPLEELVNKSINETLSRTIVTSLVVFFVVFVLFIKGEGDIRDFAFAMIIGVVTGTYSSIFIASPFYIFLKKHGHRLGLSPAPVEK